MAPTAGRTFTPTRLPAARAKPSFTVSEAKTKLLLAQIGKLGFGNTTLVIDGDMVDNGFALASSNIPKLNVMPAVGANVYDIMRHETLVLTRAAVEKLEARFNG